jgi:outer membrane protein assembly factor BamB
LLVLSVACLARAVEVRAKASTETPQSFPSVPVWTIEVPAQPVVASPPVSSGDRLFVALESGIAAFRLANGAQIWTAKIVADGPMAISADRLLVQSKGELHALSTEDGRIVWSDRTGRLTAPPLVHGERLFVASGEQMTAYLAADGSKQWTRDVGVIEQRPAVEGIHMYLPAADGRLVALNMESGKPIWEHDVGIKPTEPVVYGDRVLVGSAAKHFCSLKMQTGEEDWCWPVGAEVIGAAAVDERHVYFVALDNLLRAHDRRHGALKWKQDLRYRPSAGPSLIGTTVGAPGSTSSLQAFDAATGKAIGRLSLPEALVAPLTFIASDGGPVRVAALAGGLNNKWTLTLAEPPPPTPPDLKVAPLTVLPGVAIPLGGRPTPRGQPGPGAGPLLQYDRESVPKTTAG